jgi:hypothetical protein
MDQELKQKIEEQGVKIDAIYKSVEKTRKYFLMIIWVTIITIVVPLVVIMFILPSFISNYTDTLGGLGI